MEKDKWCEDVSIFVYSHDLAKAVGKASAKIWPVCVSPGSVNASKLVSKSNVIAYHIAIHAMPTHFHPRDVDWEVTDGGTVGLDGVGTPTAGKYSIFLIYF